MDQTRHPRDELRVAYRHLSELQATNARKRYSIATVRRFAAEEGELDQEAAERLAEAEQELEHEEGQADELQRRILVLEERARRLR